jgi:hypothetical protein
MVAGVHSAVRTAVLLCLCDAFRVAEWSTARPSREVVRLAHAHGRTDSIGLRAGCFWRGRGVGFAPLQLKAAHTCQPVERGCNARYKEVKGAADRAAGERL